MCVCFCVCALTTELFDIPTFGQKDLKNARHRRCVNAQAFSFLCNFFVWASLDAIHHTHCDALTKNMLQFLLISARAKSNPVKQMHCYLPKFWQGKLDRSSENRFQLMKLHHCSCITLSKLRHILSKLCKLKSNRKKYLELVIFDINWLCPTMTITVLECSQLSTLI